MRTRILLIVGSTLALMLAVILVATRTILVRGYESMELSIMGLSVDRVLNAIERDLETLGRTATDWGSWDETYDFVETLSPAYVEANLTDQTIENLGVDIMAYTAADGRFVHVKALGTPAEDLETLVDRYPALGGGEGARSPADGIVLLGAKPWLIASRPILDNDELFEPRGRLIIGRALNAERLDELSSRVRLELGLGPVTGPDAPPRLFDPSSKRDPGIEHPAADRLRTHVPLTDLAATPVAALTVEERSDIRRGALRSTLASVASIIATGLIFGAAALAFLERRILSRLHTLSSQVLSIKTGEKTSQRLDVAGTDEIAYLAAAINGMLAALESSTEELRQSERRNLAFLDAVPDLILLLNADDTIRDLRIPAESMIDLSVDPKGLTLSSLDRDFESMGKDIRPRLESAIRAARETQTTGFLEIDVTVHDAEDQERQKRYLVRVSATASGEAMVVARDATDQRRAQEAERKDLLLRETHHRVRNNLQVISSLLALQANTSPDPDTRALLEESQDRIRSMALIHERLSHIEMTGGLGFASYLGDLVEHLERSYGDAGRIRIEPHLEDVMLPEDASLPAGLLVNELLTNALRHAYPDGRSGEVRIGLGPGEAGNVEIRVEDDGVGLPDWVDPEQPMTLGFRIVRALVDQIGATLRVDRTQGSRFLIGIRVPTPAES